MKIFIILILFPFLVKGQGSGPRFENDTLYTSSGYKIYKGCELHFSKGTGAKGKFRYVQMSMASNDREFFEDRTIIVNKISRFKISDLGNGTIRIKGSRLEDVKYGNEMEFTLYFDRAIQPFPGLPAELIVPEESVQAVF